MTDGGTPSVSVTYVDGTTACFPVDEWREHRADGVDIVVVRNRSGPSSLSGHSAYWLYREGDVWVAGQASFGYSPVLPPEVLFLPDGTQATRRIEYVPDMPHAAVKLGWWRPGTEGKVE